MAVPDLVTEELKQTSFKHVKDNSKRKALQDVLGFILDTQWALDRYSGQIHHGQLVELLANIRLPTLRLVAVELDAARWVCVAANLKEGKGKNKSVNL